MFSSKTGVIIGYFKYIQISIHPCLLKYHGLSMEMVNLGSIMLMMNHALILMQFLNKTISNKMKSIWHVHAAPLTATEG